MSSITLYRLYVYWHRQQRTKHIPTTRLPTFSHEGCGLDSSETWLDDKRPLAPLSNFTLYLTFCYKNKILHRIVSKIWHAVNNKLRIPPLINLVILPPCFRERKIFTHFAQKVLICWETLFKAHRAVFCSLHLPFFPFDLIINMKFQLAKKLVSESLGWWILLLGLWILFLTFPGGKWSLLGNSKYRRGVINVHKILFWGWGEGGSWNDVLAGTYQLQLTKWQVVKPFFAQPCKFAMWTQVQLTKIVQIYI